MRNSATLTWTTLDKPPHRRENDESGLELKVLWKVN